MLVCLETAGEVGNSVDAHQTSYSVVSDLCRHFLLRTVFPNAYGTSSIFILCSLCRDRNHVVTTNPYASMRTAHVLTIHILFGLCKI